MLLCLHSLHDCLYAGVGPRLSQNKECLHKSQLYNPSSRQTTPVRYPLKTIFSHDQSRHSHINYSMEHTHSPVLLPWTFLLCWKCWSAGISDLHCLYSNTETSNRCEQPLDQRELVPSKRTGTRPESWYLVENWYLVRELVTSTRPENCTRPENRELVPGQRTVPGRRTENWYQVRELRTGTRPENWEVVPGQRTENWYQVRELFFNCSLFSDAWFSLPSALRMFIRHFLND